MMNAMICRSEMPQIRSNDLPAFLDFARAKGVGVYNREILADRLKFRQAVDPAHAAAMPAVALDKGVLVSNDMVVLDGNHRAAANAALGRRAQVVVIGLDFADAIDLMFAFPGVMDLVQSVAVRGQ